MRSIDETLLEALTAVSAGIGTTGDLVRLWLTHPQTSGLKFVCGTWSPNAAELFRTRVDLPGGALLRSIFVGDRFFFVDADMALRTHQLGAATLHAYPLVAVDTQVVSYFARALEGDTASGRMVSPILDHIRELGMNVDSNMFLFENWEAIARDGSAGSPMLARNLRALVVLREYIHTPATRPDETLIAEGVEELISVVREAGPEPPFSPRRLHKPIYALLLKATQIQLTKPRDSLKSKTRALLDFALNDLDVLMQREIAICIAYLSEGQDLRFFSKVQKGNPKGLRVLNGMAWDLVYLRFQELVLTEWFTLGVPVAPVVATFDKRLGEIIDHFPLWGVLLFGPADTVALPTRDFHDLVAAASDYREDELNLIVGVGRRQRASALEPSPMERFSAIALDLEREVGTLLRAG